MSRAQIARERAAALGWTVHARLDAAPAAVPVDDETAWREYRSALRIEVTYLPRETVAAIGTLIGLRPPQ